MPRGWMQERGSLFPAAHGIRGTDPFAVRELPGPDVRAFARRKAREIETGVETDRQGRRGDPAARRGERSGVDAQAMRSQEIREGPFLGARCLAAQERLRR